MAKQVPEARPDVIEICESAHVAFAQAASLIRDSGYVFSVTRPPQMFSSGQAAITLEFGDLLPEAVAGAAEAFTLALAREQAQQQRDNAEAEARTREYEERMAKQAEIALQIAEAKKHLKQLEQAHRSA